jgi:hypothetical protein
LIDSLDIELPPSDVDKPRFVEQVQDDNHVACVFFDFQQIAVVRYRREGVRLAGHVDAYQSKQILSIAVQSEARECAGWYSVHENLNFPLPEFHND